MIDQGKIERGVELILKGIGVDLRDRNFLLTPERVARYYAELFEKKDTEFATFPESYNDFILLRNHRMFSLCPHHLLPVRFDVSLAYVPNGHVLGLSKLARVLDECNSGPLLQEKFTGDVVKEMGNICQGVQGVACVIVGKHGCTEIRGVRSNAEFVTYKLSGCFNDNEKLAERFFYLTGVK